MTAENSLNVEEVVERYVKPFGLFQLFIVCLSALSCLPSEFISVFLLQVPKYRCRVDDVIEKNTNFTFDDMAKLAGPWLDESAVDYFTDVSQYGCFKYDEFGNFESKIRKCDNGFVYEAFSYQYPDSIIKHMDLVCDRSWLVPSSNAIYMFGVMLGFVLGVKLSVSFSRRKLIIFFSTLQTFFAYFISFVSSYTSFVILRFCLAISVSSKLISFSCLITEFTIAKQRRLLVVINSVISTCVLRLFTCIFAYFIHDWRLFNAISMIYCLTLIVFPNFLPESPHWLVSQGNYKAAVIQLYNAYKINHLQSSRFKKQEKLFFEDRIEKCENNVKFSWIKTIMQYFSCKKLERAKVGKQWKGINCELTNKLMDTHGKFGLFKLLFLSNVLLSVQIMSLYGIMFYIRHLKSSIYVSSATNAFVVLPALILFLFLWDANSSNRSILITIYSSAAFLLILIGSHMMTFKNIDEVYLSVCINLSYFLLTISMHVLCPFISGMHSAEYRFLLLNYSVAVSYIGGIACDFVNELDLKVMHGLPLFIYGVILILQNVILFLMVEKRNLKIQSLSSIKRKGKKSHEKLECQQDSVNNSDNPIEDQTIIISQTFADEVTAV